MQSNTNFRAMDFEQLGHDVMLQAGSIEMAGAICGQKIRAFEQAIVPELLQVREELSDQEAHYRGLWEFLHGRAVPVNLASMLSRRMRSHMLAGLLIACSCASIACNSWTLSQLGLDPLLSIGVGLGLTLLVMAIMFFAHSMLAQSSQGGLAMELGVVLLSVGLCGWGLLEFAGLRSEILEYRAVQQRASNTRSFVDRPELQSHDAPPDDQGAEARIANTSGNAMFAMAISAELITGILLAFFMRFQEDADYAAWKKLEELVVALSLLRKVEHQLLSQPIIARELCMAGILRAKTELRRRPSPYHRYFAMIIIGVALMLAVSLRAQTFDHAEGILIDASGSVGQHSNKELFREYLRSARQLLLTEPQKSRAWVSLVTSDSFGHVRPITSGWTPESKGVFTGDLNRARRDLASSFEATTTGLLPTSVGTDIFGGLWRMKALLDSINTRDREIWILSDMRNDTKSFPMTKLLAEGADAMLRRAQAQHLVVSLDDYRIHVLGASFSDLDPESWNTVRSFWVAYFRAAGATLIKYSAEVSANTR